MSTLRLLLIEDDRADQMGFQRFVEHEQLPYDYRIACSVAEATAALQEEIFDLILADQALGDGTAFDLFPLIPRETPIVFVTGTGNEETAVRAIKMGAADYLTKDINGDYLKLLPITINNVINARRAQEELEVYRNQLEQLVQERTQALLLEISERQRVERQLMSEKEKAQVTLKSIGDAVITTDVNGLIEFINPAAEKLTGWLHGEGCGQHIEEVFTIIHESTRKPYPNPIYRCLAQNRITFIDDEVLLINRKGQEYCIQDSAAPIHDAEGHIQGVVLVFSDVTTARRLSQQLAYQATHDPLTGLVNRRECEQRLQRLLETQKIEGGYHAFCYLDLDQFKIVNDTCGHSAGDELLKQISVLLMSRVRKRDTLARLGGDEFGVLMEHCSIRQAERVANDLRATIEKFCFHWENKLFRVGVSIGLIPVSDEFATLNDLLIAADASCYAAKDAGRNRVHVYRKENGGLSMQTAQLQWIVKLNDALDHHRLKLFKQPIIALKNGLSTHCEVLVRMEDPTHANTPLIPPGAFIPAAERYGMMPKIDRLVIEESLKWLASNTPSASAYQQIAINLSGHTLCCEWLLDFIFGRLAHYGVTADRLCFEITETAAIANFNFATQLIKKLKARGCTFALDDFGSGLSSFAYLRNLPVDYLKIDGLFVREIANDPIDFAMVRSINEIGHLLGKYTIAEFVENQLVLDRLHTIGVDFAQGYYLNRPEPLESEPL